jgi:very-short-patch-repair endonuclease
MSVSQRRLWHQLRAHRSGFHFRREVPVGRYVLDFYCSKARLCVEVDGDQHSFRRERDRNRDAYLAVRGITTIRFGSQECFSNAEGVALSIQRMCMERLGVAPS